MLTHRIIPCLDVNDGRVVKGINFSGLKDAGDPAELAESYQNQGADEIVLLDVSATPQGRSTQLDCVRRVRRRLAIPLTVGGGVRRVENAEALLEAGADKISVNTAAVEDPGLLQEMAARFGSQCTVLALDAARFPDRDGFEVVVLSGRKRTGMDALDWAEKATRLGSGEILLTSWDRDGTKAGYDIDLIRGVSERTSVPIIASGGAATPEHMQIAIQAGADAVLAASIFHYAESTVQQIKAALLHKGIEVRP